MADWVVRYWADVSENNAVEAWLDSLTKEQLKAVSKELILLGYAGNQLRLPHSRSLGSGLFELRERKFGFRVYYGFMAGKVIVLLCAGDKSTQKKDIATARERLDELKGEK